MYPNLINRAIARQGSNSIAWRTYTRIEMLRLTVPLGRRKGHKKAARAKRTKAK